MKDVLIKSPEAARRAILSSQQGNPRGLHQYGSTRNPHALRSAEDLAEALRYDFIINSLSQFIVAKGGESERGHHGLDGAWDGVEASGFVEASYDELTPQESTLKIHSHGRLAETEFDTNLVMTIDAQSKRLMIPEKPGIAELKVDHGGYTTEGRYVLFQAEGVIEMVPRVLRINALQLASIGGKTLDVAALGKNLQPAPTHAQ